MKYIIIYAQFMLVAAFGNAQSTGALTIDECYLLAKAKLSIDKTTGSYR